MYGGRFVEVAGADEIFRAPQHPYTIALLSAVPVPDPMIEREPAGSASRGSSRLTGRRRLHLRLALLEGGGALRGRAAAADQRTGHLSACHFPENVA